LSGISHVNSKRISQKEGTVLLEKEYMRLAITLARGMKGQTTPNPPVGAVVVNDGAIVGLGAHLAYGEKHAEAIALDMAKEKAEGGTVYVTLEPCSHYGKTGPCADYLIDKKVRRVVIACRDVNEKVAGKGIARLQSAGIIVEEGFLFDEARSLYDVFFHFISRKRPFVTLKAAMSLDGKTATSSLESKWITNEAARMDAHAYRHEHDAILVGINTVLEDDPKLTNRLPEGRQPVRIVLDTDLRTPLAANVASDGLAETWIFVGSHIAASKIESFDSPHVRIIQMDDETVEIKRVLEWLGREQISSVLVEGGATINGSFLKDKLIDKLVIYMAPIVIGGEQAPGAFAGKGFARLKDALELHIQEVTMVEGQIKIVATKEENDVYGNR